MNRSIPISESQVIVIEKHQVSVSFIRQKTPSASVKPIKSKD